MAKKKTPKNLPKPTYMGGGAGGARTSSRGAAAGSKSIPKRKATGIKNAKGLDKMKKALSTSTPPKRTTRASQPTSQLERNIGRHSTLRKKFPDKFKP